MNTILSFSELGPLALLIFAGIISFIILLFSKFSYSKNIKLKYKRSYKNQGPFTHSQVLQHNTIDDAWIIIDSKVYDITEYIDIHPGGDAILNNVGKDSSMGFRGDQHPPSVWDVIKEYYIGDLIDE